MNKPERQTLKPTGDTYSLNGGESGYVTETVSLCCILMAPVEPAWLYDRWEADPDSTLPAFRSLDSEEINAALEVIK